MIVPAHAYLGPEKTTPEALDCLRRDLVSGETACEGENRLIVWQALLLTSNESDFSSVMLDLTRQRAVEHREQQRTIKPSEESDPLSSNGSWDLFYRDRELRLVIAQDCERVFPEMDWFHGPEEQTLLQECLFTWCKENRDVSYKQGMHEIAAIVIFVVFQYSKEGLSHMQADCDALFHALMRHLKKFYEIPPTGASEIVKHATRIQDELLTVLDPELAERLRELDIEPQIYCIKWLRLMYAREFEFEEVLSLWDTIIAADSTLALLDFIACAMLMRIRKVILDDDANAALTALIRYPSSKQPPTSFVQDALHMRNNFNTRAGAEIIERHSGGQSANQVPLQLGLRQPLAPSAMGALLHQTELLGINNYVRGAVEEVKRNVNPIFGETRQALARTHSRDLSITSTPNPGPAITTSARDRELASVLALVISNLKNGDDLRDNISRLEDIKVVLQGRKNLLDLATRSTRPSTIANGQRPSSSPEARSALVPPKRGMSPIRIPAIKIKSLTSESHARAFVTDVSTHQGENKDDIPLSESPKRSSLKKASEFSFLFADDKAMASTFNRPRKV